MYAALMELCQLLLVFGPIHPVALDSLRTYLGSGTDAAACAATLVAASYKQ
jgi:hypothetical protein